MAEKRDFNIFMDVLDNRQILKDCSDVSYTARVSEDGKQVTVLIHNLEVGFVFDRIEGHLLYAYNWKQ